MAGPTNNIIVTREVLTLYDKYNGDFGMLHERGANEADKHKLTSEQMLLFSEYEDKLHLIKIDNARIREMQQKALIRLPELEKLIDPEVVQILKHRILGE